MRIEAVRLPKGGGRLASEGGDIGRDQRTKTVRRVRDPVGGGSDRPGELGHFVHHQVRFERLDNGPKVLDALRYLRSDEELGEGMAADLGRGQGGKNLAMMSEDPGSVIQACPQAGQAAPSTRSAQWLAGSDRYLVSSRAERFYEGTHRVVVTNRGPTREQDAHETRP